MQFDIVATTSANPQAFANTIIENVKAVWPDARVNVRPIFSHSDARLSWIETDCASPIAIENIRLLCDVATDWLKPKRKAA